MKEEIESIGMNGGGLWCSEGEGEVPVLASVYKQHWIRGGGKKRKGEGAGRAEASGGTSGLGLG